MKLKISQRQSTGIKFLIDIDNCLLLLYNSMKGVVMRGIIRDTLLIGFGIASLGRKKLKNVYNILKTEGEAFKDEIPVIKKRWQKVETLSDRLDEMGQKFFQRLNIVTRTEFSELNKKIEKILKQKSVAD